MVPSERPPARDVTADQAADLLRVHVKAGSRDPVAGAVARMSAVLGVKVVVAKRHGQAWSICAESDVDQPAPPVDRASRFDELIASSAGVTRCLTVGSVEWTVAVQSPSAHLALLVQGDWTAAARTLEAVVANLGLAARAHVTHTHDRRRLWTHGLARRLAAANGTHAVSELIARRMARAVGARFSALALPDSSGRRLAIVATSGYPLELVEHLRIERGDGIVGTVFETGRMLHRSGGDSVPQGWRRRPRYRTDSFVAMPIRASHDTLGVICVADRLDDEPFSDEDVRTLRALAAIAALALARERAAAQAESYAHAAAVDPLTGTFNRRYFQTRLEEELERSRRHALSLTLLLVDIDNFKNINDTHGHLAGDSVLKDIAEILRRSVRMFDVCARFGGEEFAIIMPGSNAESVATVAERIRERIEAYRPSEPALTDVRITVSIGIGVSSLQMSPRELINRADQALYLAKRAGKNVVRAVGDDAS